jgi:hypothetical protein
MAGVTRETSRIMLDLVRFRIATAVGAVLAVVALFLSTLWTWFSENPALFNPPATLVSRWNLWSILSNGGGDMGFAGLDGLAPGASINVTVGPTVGGLETDLGFVVLACLVLTLVALVLTAVRASWTDALAVVVCATATFAFEAVLRSVGDGNHLDPKGPVTYFSGSGLAAAQWIAAAVVVWAVSLAVVARRDWRVRDGLLPALSDAS